MRFLLFLLIPITLQAQNLETNAEEYGYYYVIAGEDTISQHVQEYKAIESAHNYAMWVPGDTVRISRNLEISVVHGEKPIIRDIQWSQVTGNTNRIGVSFDVSSDTAWVDLDCMAGDSVSSYSQGGQSPLYFDIYCQKAIFRVTAIGQDTVYSDYQVIH